MSNVLIHDEDEIEMSADVHDHLYAGSQVSLIPDAPGYEFTGIDPNGICTNGWEILIVNETANAVTLKHNDAGSSTGNRFFFADNADHTLGAYEMIWGTRKETVAGRVGWWLEIP